MWGWGAPGVLPVTLRFTSAGRGLDIDWLGEYDMEVLQTLSVTRVASSDQIGRLHFAESLRACQRCLARLSRGRLVTRLARRVGGVSPGSTPWAYSLAPAGQRLLGVAGPRGGRVRRPGVPSPMFLRHMLLATEVYVCAIEVSRVTEGPLRVHRFVTEPDCWRRLPDGKTMKPDAELVLAGDGYEDHYLIEVDCGTEGPSALGRKLALYRQLFQAGSEQEARGVFPRVLFVTLNEGRREQLGAQLARQPKDIRPVFSVTHLSHLPAVLSWGPDDGEETGR